MFKRGDSVTLQQGESPVMTVERTLPDEKAKNGVVYCVWFDKAHVLHRDHFSMHLLKMSG